MTDNSLSRLVFGTLKGAGTAALAAVLAAGTPALSPAQGLKLDTAKEKVLEQYDKPNPHFELDCEDCHEGKPDPKKVNRMTVKLANGKKGIVDLCYNCHDESDNIHPIHVNPTKAEPKIKVPRDFPLEMRGEHKVTVVCTTCHFIHSKTAGLKLLRGFPESSAPEDLAKARFSDRRDFCKSCHGEGLSQKSPHKGKGAEKKNCSFCHATEPKEGEPVEFTKGLIELCDFCHAATKGAHYLLVNPFADPNLTEEIAKAGVPLIEGEFTCVTCHNPHGTELDKFLRPAFVDLALKSTRIRPHFMLAFCEACHTVKPKVAKGEPGAQPLAEIPLRSEDPNVLCNRCHESGLSKANAHPIKVVSEKFQERIPSDWPTYQGSLTCLTCHTGGDSPVLDPKNPSFLRGAPYETRNQICWTCHLREEFSELDPHEDVQEGKGCEFCHATKMDIEKLGQDQDVKFKGDIVLLCIRCHDDSAHPADHDHTGVPDQEFMAEKNITIPPEFPLDHLGRVTCATCHNPHSYGAQRGTVSGMAMCAICHQF
jgi:hypothetical protein